MGLGFKSLPFFRSLSMRLLFSMATGFFFSQARFRFDAAVRFGLNPPELCFLCLSQRCDFRSDSFFFLSSVSYFLFQTPLLFLGATIGLGFKSLTLFRSLSMRLLFSMATGFFFLQARFSFDTTVSFSLKALELFFLCLSQRFNFRSDSLFLF